MAVEFTPKQLEFIQYFNDPESPTYSNITKSGVRAGFSQSYSENLSHLVPTWFKKGMEKREKMLKKAEDNLETLLDSEDEKVKADITKFIAKTIGKDIYSERQEVTGKDGKDLIPTPIMDLTNVQQDNINKENSIND